MSLNKIDYESCQLPFSIANTQLEKCRAELTRLRALYLAALKIQDQIAADLAQAEVSSGFATAAAVRSNYILPMSKLAAANWQGNFLAADERENVEDGVSNTDTLVSLWQNPEFLASARALLEKYAAASAAEPKDITPRYASEDDDREYDYTPIIKLARQANEQLMEVAA